jgi:hypothetical protein
LAEASLYIGVAMVLAISCQPEGTYYRCCPVFTSTAALAHSGAVVVVVDVAIAKALILGVHALASEGFLLLVVALIGLLFLIQSTAL